MLLEWTNSFTYLTLLRSGNEQACSFNSLDHGSLLQRWQPLAVWVQRYESWRLPHSYVTQTLHDYLSPK